MSAFTLFEAAVDEDTAPDVQQRVASRRLESAIYDVGQVYGRFLLGATGLDEFEDRWHYSKADIRRTVEPHLMPVTGVMRRVHDALKKEFKVKQRTAALDDAPDQHLQETFHPDSGNLIPEDNWEGYKDEVSQGGPEKVDSHDFTSGDDSGNDRPHEGRLAFVLDVYSDWARSNGLRVASTSSLMLYSENCTDDEYRQIHAAIKRAGDADDDEGDDEKDVDEDKERLEEDEEREAEDSDDEDDDEGDDEGDEDEDDSDDDDGDDKDDAPPWLTGARNYLADVTEAPDEDPEDDEQAGASEPPPQDPSAAPPAPGGDVAPQAPPGDQPPVDAGQPPAQLENQPAEDHLLDTANDAVSQMIDRETQEYQQKIDPLSQALQAIEYAQQVEQQSNPLDVTPPDGTVDVGPQDAATGAPVPDLSQGPPQGAPPPQQLQQQAARIAQRYGMTKQGYRMILQAMGRRHYQTVADAIAGLPVEHRGPIAASLGDMFAAENPRFRHDPFFAASGVDPRTISASRLGFNRLSGEWGLPEIFNRDRGYASDVSYPQSPEEAQHGYLRDLMEEGPPGAPGRERTPWEQHPEDDWGRYSGVSWNETKNAPLAEHHRYDVDPSNWGDTDPYDHGYDEDADDRASAEQSHWEGDPGYQEHMYSWDQPPDAPHSTESDDFDNPLAGSRMYEHFQESPHSFGQPVQPNRWGYRQADAGTLTPGETMDSFEFPNQHVNHPKDNLTVTPDNMGTASGMTLPKKAAMILEEKVRREAKGVMDMWNQNVKQRSQNGLVTDPEASFSDFSEKVKGKVSPDALNRVKQKVVPSATPVTPKVPATPAAPKVKAANGFFTRRVPGWNWDDHLAAYVAKEAAPFTCVCGSMFDVPSYYNCRCGKIFNAYPVGQGGDERTASVDIYLCREIPVRPDVIMANRRVACDGDCNGTCPEHVEWVTDEDREDADAPHAPGKNATRASYLESMMQRGYTAAIGDDDHTVVTRDGDKYCSKCDALLWDPNVHHCPAKQATRAMFGEMKPKDERDDSPTVDPDNDEDGDNTTLTDHLKKRVDEKKGTDGEEAKEHAKGKASRAMFGDWTVYDDGLGGGSRSAPSTDVSRPPEDWARRGPETGPRGQWAPPLFRHQ